MTCVIGIDIAKHTFDIAKPLERDKYRTKAKVANTPEGFKQFDQWLEKHAEPHCWVLMEATSVYHEALATHLHQQGYQVCVINPARIAKYAQSELRRVKTDKTDAKLIARYAQRHLEELRPWEPEPESIRQLRGLVRRLADLKELAQMERNRLDVSAESAQASIRIHLKHLEGQVALISTAINDHIDNDPDLREQKRLMKTIDGVSDGTAATLLAELGSPLRFDSARQLAAFCGLNPRLQESGIYRGKSTISRTGSGRLRAALYMPALSAMTYNPVIKAMKVRLAERGKTGRLVVCAAMRKLLHLIYGVLKSGQPFDPIRALAH